MKTILIFTLLISYNLCSMTQQELKKDYEKMFHIYTKSDKDGVHIIAEAKQLPQNHKLYELVTNNRYYFDYLVKNAIDYSDMGEFATDTMMLAMEFLVRLDTSAAFNNAITASVHSFLLTKGDAIQGYTFTPEEMIYDQLATKAVRFFEPYRVNETGMVVSNIINGVTTFKDYEGIREFISEAFLYQALMMETVKRKHNLNMSFSKLMKELMTFPFSQDEEAKIKRLQGALWYLFSKDQNLKKVIVEEYNRTRTWLPISIIDLP